MWAFPFGAGLALFGAGPDRVRARRRVARRDRAARRPRGGGRAAAGRLQLVRVLPRARASPGRRRSSRRRSARRSPLLAVPGALLGGSWGFVAGRVGCTACVLAVRHVYVRRLLPGVRLCGAGAARGGAGRARLGAGAGRAAGAVGRGADARGRRCSSSRCGSAASRSRPTGSRAACSPSCAATCARAARRREPSPWRRALAPASSGAPRVAARCGSRCSGSPPRSISGFTLRRYLGPLDEGILMQAATRMADGQWPWRDFGWSYGPGRAAGRDGARQALRPVAAVVAAAAGRRRRDRRGARLRARPRPPPALGARRLGRRRGHRRPADEREPHRPGARLRARRGAARDPRAARRWAGARRRAAAFWRPDVGAIAALAAAATLRRGARRDASGGRAPRRAARGAASAGAGRRGGRGDGARRGAARRGERAGRVRRARVPPAPRRSRAAAVRAASSPRRAVLVLYAPFLVAAGPGTVWDALVVQATRDGEWWRLPFPRVRRRGREGLPDVAAAVRARSCSRSRSLRSGGRSGSWSSAPARRCTSQLRADLEHAQGAAGRRGGGWRRSSRPRLVGRAAARAAARWSASANRASALLEPPDLEPFGSVRVPPDEAAALPTHGRARAAARPAGRADLRRAAALGPRDVHATRSCTTSPTGRTSCAATCCCRPSRRSRQRIVAALERARPKVIVRWIAPESAKPEPNRRGRPSGSRALDDYLDERLRARTRASATTRCSSRADRRASIASA